MKKYERGTTLVEILISVLIIALVLVSLTSLLNQVRDDESKSSIQSNYIINQAIYIKTIEEDITDFGLKNVYSCNINEANISSNSYDSSAGSRCIKLVYDSTYIKDNIGFIIIYHHYTKFNKTDGKGYEPKWTVKYERGYYTKNKDLSSWKMTTSTANEYPDEMSLGKTPYVLFTALQGSTAVNAASIVIPIVSSSAEHYDINIGFNFDSTSKFVCDNRYTDKLNCYCKELSSSNGICNTMLLKSIETVSSAYDSTLKSLSVKVRDSGGKLHSYDLGFKANVYNYKVDLNEYGINSLKYVTSDSDINNNQIGLNYSTNSSLSTSEMKNGTNIELGNNNKKIVVTAANGDVTTYTINFVRSYDTNNYLSYLETGIDSIGFNKQTNNYIVNVSSSIQSLHIRCAAESKFATVSGCNIDLPLSPGSNYHEITVIAENGSQNTYSLQINKVAESDTRLKSLTSSDGVLAKQSDYYYLLYIDDEPLRLNITAVSNSDRATATGGGTYVVQDGDNIYVTVTAEDGTVSEYLISVKLNDNDDSSSEIVKVTNGTISKIDEYNYKIKLDSGVTEFDVIGPFGTIPCSLENQSYENEFTISMQKDPDDASTTVTYHFLVVD